MTAVRCSLCPRQCDAPRARHAGEGACGMGMEPVVARAALHFGEEPCISGTRGSGTIFFCGCALRCVFCQNDEISHGRLKGRAVTADVLGELFARLRDQGAHNINLVTGAHFVGAIAEALRKHPPGILVVYNSSGYESPEALTMLSGLVDIYLPDFKYADAELSSFLSGARDYPQVALSAICEMRRQTGKARYDFGGLMQRGTLVRHLVLPGLTGASMRALCVLRDCLPDDVPISLMGQYTPYGAAKGIKGLDRRLTARGYKRVEAQMRALGFDGYVQPVSASGDEAIPEWTLCASGRPAETAGAGGKNEEGNACCPC